MAYMPIKPKSRQVTVMAPVRWDATTQQILLDLVHHNVVAPTPTQAIAVTSKKNAKYGDVIVGYPISSSDTMVILQLSPAEWSAHARPARARVPSMSPNTGVGARAGGPVPPHRKPLVRRGTQFQPQPGKFHRFTKLGRKRGNSGGGHYSKQVYYRGVKMASITEARHCTLLDVMGVSWDYEADDTVINYYGNRYTPDLSVHHMPVNGAQVNAELTGLFHVVIEIKPTREAGAREVDKCRECSEQLAARARAARPPRKPPIVVLFFGKMKPAFQADNKSRSFVGSDGLLGNAWYDGKPLGGYAYWSVGLHPRTQAPQLELFLGHPKPANTNLVHYKLLHAYDMARTTRNFRVVHG